MLFTAEHNQEMCVSKAKMLHKCTSLNTTFAQLRAESMKFTLGAWISRGDAMLWAWFSGGVEMLWARHSRESTANLTRSSKLVSGIFMVG